MSAESHTVAPAEGGDAESTEDPAVAAIKEKLAGGETLSPNERVLIQGAEADREVPWMSHMESSSVSKVRLAVQHAAKAQAKKECRAHLDAQSNGGIIAMKVSVTDPDATTHGVCNSGGIGGEWQLRASTAKPSSIKRAGGTSRRRDSHSAAPSSTSSRCFNRDGEGASTE